MTPTLDRFAFLTVTLTATEQERVTRPIVGRGGHQDLLRTVLSRFDPLTGVVTINPALLPSMRAYAEHYGGGGYQMRFRALLAAVARAETTR